MRLRNVFGAIIVLVSVNEAIGGALYTLEDLGIVGRSAIGAAINNTGQVVASVLPADQLPGLPLPGAVYSIENGASTALETLGGFNTVIARNNNSGVAVGLAELPTGELRSVRFVNGQVEDLSVFGNLQSGASAINDFGDIVGLAYYPGSHRAYLRYPTGETLDLGTLGGNVSSAVDINNRGQVVGSARPAGNLTSLAFIYNNSTMVSLGSLGGGASYASAINDAGFIVGESNRADGIVHAFVYDPILGMQDIGIGSHRSTASDISNANVIVGSTESTPGDLRAFIYDQRNGMRLLESLVNPDNGWSTLLRADSVNDSGQIVGIGLINGQTHVFLATPVPEPSLMATLIVASCLLSVRRIH
jgi:probable HAF family extracellular repeat protein